MITNKKYKKWRTIRKHGYQRENSLKISDEKRNSILALENFPVEHKGFDWTRQLDNALVSSKN